MTAAAPLPQPAPQADGAQCPRHQRPAVAPCERCGTFRCEECGDSAWCLSCRERNTEPFLFPTTPLKLGVLFVATFGLYGIVWAYKQWSHVKRGGEDVWPIPRSIFLGFTSFDLFGRIAHRLEREGLEVGFAPKLMGGLILLGNFSNRLPDPFWLIGLAQVVPLIIVQGGINRLNAKLTPGADRNESWGAGAILTTLIGLVLWGLVLLGFVMPDEVATVP